MIEIHPEYIVDENDKKKAVVVSYDDWQQLLEEIEELNDIRAYDKAKSESDETLDFEKGLKTFIE